MDKKKYKEKNKLPIGTSPYQAFMAIKRKVKFIGSIAGNLYKETKIDKGYYDMESYMKLSQRERDRIWEECALEAREIGDNYPLSYFLEEEDNG